jgi:hypothetical protein
VRLLLHRATTSVLIASVTPLDPPGVSEVDATIPTARDRALSQSVAPTGQAAVAVETADRLLKT